VVTPVVSRAAKMAARQGGDLGDEEFAEEGAEGSDAGGDGDSGEVSDGGGAGE
jgi:hypothetical protein